MRALVLHTTLNACGGGERVAIATIEVLKRMGFKVVLSTIEPTDWSRVRRLFGTDVRPDEEVSLLPFSMRAFGIYMRLASTINVLRLRKRCVVSINTFGDAIPVPCDITYMHFPTHTIAKLAPENQKYVASTFWKLYFTPYERIQSRIVDSLENTVLLTNSRFSASIIRRFLGYRALVVYPPVDIEKFMAISTPPEKREDIVVSIGRYNPEKRYEFILSVAARMPDVRFIIVGSTGEALAKNYFLKLMRLREKLKLGNVELLRDVPLNELLNILSRAKIYLHAMLFEHFGMAPVEAMAAGLVPVVHASGGPYTDVIEFGRYGYGFKGLYDCIEKIYHALDNYQKWYPIVREASKRFSKNRFLEKMDRIVRKVVDHAVS